MSDVDVSATCAPKSDQLNADDLIGGPRTVTVTEVRGSQGDQPIAIHYQGDDGRPYKPCKSMRRVLVNAWGSKGSEYVGRSMTLVRDPHVKFGGIEVGGIRISHMSHLPSEALSMALTVTRAKREMYTVRRLAVKGGEGSAKGDAQAKGGDAQPDRRPESPGNLESALKAIESSAPEAIEALKATLRETAWSRDSSAKIAAAFKARG